MLDLTALLKYRCSFCLAQEPSLLWPAQMLPPLHVLAPFFTKFFSLLWRHFPICCKQFTFYTVFDQAPYSGLFLFVHKNHMYFKVRFACAICSKWWNEFCHFSRNRSSHSTNSMKYRICFKQNLQYLERIAFRIPSQLWVLRDYKHFIDGTFLSALPYLHFPLHLCWAVRVYGQRQ